MTVQGQQYTGNAVDNRDITIAAGFGTPTFELTKRMVGGILGSFGPVCRTDTMGAGDLCKSMLTATAIAGYTNRIQALGAVADSFQVGTDDEANHNLATYYALAGINTGGQFATGSYAGNATNPRAITGLAFAPVLVIVMPSGAALARYRSGAMTGSNSQAFTNGAIITNGIVSLDAAGFTVQSALNAVGTTYHWAAFGAADCQAIAYSGDGTNTHLIAHNRNQVPTYVIAHSIDATNLQQAVALFPAGTVNSAQWDSNSLIGQVQSANAAAVTLGANASVNTTGKAYELLVFGAVAQTARLRTLVGTGV